MDKEQVKAIEETVKAIGKAIICTQCKRFGIPNWAKNLKNVMQQCALGLEPEGGECKFFKPKTR